MSIGHPVPGVLAAFGLALTLFGCASVSEELGQGDTEDVGGDDTLPDDDTANGTDSLTDSATTTEQPTASDGDSADTDTGTPPDTGDDGGADGGTDPDSDSETDPGSDSASATDSASDSATTSDSETTCCNPGDEIACTTGCGSTGTQECLVGCGYEDCVPPAETCNGLDDDCADGADNGFRAQVQYSTYTVMSGSHVTCDGVAERFGTSCNAAFHRYCKDQGCFTSGFGPLENDADIAHAGCVIAAAVVDVSYTDLSLQQAGCDGVSTTHSPDCNAAIHRHCAALGHLSGYGPVELPDAITATVACVDATSATLESTTFTALATFLSACDGVSSRFGMACNAAINRFCASLGHVTGFGPVEADADLAQVVCVDD